MGSEDGGGISIGCNGGGAGPGSCSDDAGGSEGNVDATSCTSSTGADTGGCSGSDGPAGGAGSTSVTGGFSTIVSVFLLFLVCCVGVWGVVRQLDDDGEEALGAARRGKDEKRSWPLTGEGKRRGR